MTCNCLSMAMNFQEKLLSSWPNEWIPIKFILLINNLNKLNLIFVLVTSITLPLEDIEYLMSVEV